MIKKILMFITMLVVCFCITGCDISSMIFGDNSDDKLEFKKDCKVNYKEKNVDSTQFVKSYDGVNVKESQCDITKRIVYIGNYNLKCPIINTSKLGKQKAVYIIGEEKYTLEVTIVDLEKPIITLESNSKDIYVGEVFSKEDIKYTVTDNLSKKKDIKTSIKGNFDINTKGSYTININATDKNKNKSTAIFTLNVIEKPVEDVPQTNQDTNSNSNSNSNKQINGNSSNSSTSNNNSSNSNSTYSNPSQYNKTFTGDINTTYSQAESYGESIVNSGKAKGYSIQSFGDQTSITFE